MRLQEVAAKNVCGHAGPFRIKVGDTLTEVSLPESVLEVFPTILLSVFFPHSVGDLVLADMVGEDFRIGAVFTAGKNTVRIKRSLGSETVRLDLLNQTTGSYQNWKSGSEAVETSLLKKLKMRPLEDFQLLNLGYIQGVLSPAPLKHNKGVVSGDSLDGDGSDDFLLGGADSPASDLGGLLGEGQRAELAGYADPEVLRQEYENALKVEEIEDRIASLKIELGDGGQSRRSGSIDTDPELANLKEQLDLLPEIQVDAADLELLESPDKRVDALNRRKAGLENQAERLSSTVDAPGGLLRNPAFLLGIVLTLVCTIVSIVGGPGLRPIAIGNVICLGNVLAGFFQVKRQNEQRTSRRARLISIRTNLQDLDEEKRQVQLNLQDTRDRYQVESAEELQSLIEQRKALEGAYQKLLEAKQREYEKPVDLGLDQRHEQLQSELAELNKQREDLGDCPLSSVELAQELAQAGIVVSGDYGERTFDPESDLGFADEVASAPAGNPLVEVFKLARELGIVVGGGLDSNATNLWGRMISKLMGRRIDTPSFTDAGELFFTGQEDQWPKLSDVNRALAMESLLLTLLMRSIGRTVPSPMPTLLRFVPYKHLDSTQSRNLSELYGRLAKSISVVAFTPEDTFLP